MITTSSKNIHMSQQTNEDWNKELSSIKVVQHALAYAYRGWRVLPLAWPAFPGVCSCRKGKDCTSIAKHPLTANGVKDASSDMATVKKWWAKYPLANVGIATGVESDLVVLDVDGDDGQRSLLKDLFGRFGRCPTTCVSVTGSGRHILFRHPRSEKVSNGARILPGIDVRGDAGYIVAPPSLHSSGMRYEWHTLGHPGRQRLADPDWFLRVINGVKKRHKRPTHEKTDDYCIDRIPSIPDGERNNRLFKICSRFCGDGWDIAKASAEMARINDQKCNPPVSDVELEMIVSGVYKRYTAN